MGVWGVWEDGQKCHMFTTLSSTKMQIQKVSPQVCDQNVQRLIYN